MIRWTDSELASLSWHDCRFYGFALGGSEERSDLVLDIDFIVEWSCGGPGEDPFRVAVTTLTFGASGFTQALWQEPIVCAEQSLSPSTRAPLFDDSER